MNNHTLTLFMTRGMSLSTWDTIGILKREMALYQRILEKGWKVNIVTFGNSDDLIYEKQYPGLSVLCNRLSLPLRLYEAVLPYLHRRKLKGSCLFKTNQTDGGLSALRCAGMFSKPLIARCGFMLSEFKRRSGEADMVEPVMKMERELFHGADRCVVTSPTMAEYETEQLNISAEKIELIPNYVSPAFFESKWSLPQKRPLVLSIGRLNEQKNYAELIRAVAGMDATLRIIGEGDRRNELEELAVSTGCDLELPGALPHAKLPEEICRASVFAQPSLYEGHPKTLIEAMACGIPVIGTDVPGIREIISHEETGLLCGTEAPAIGSAITSVLAEPEQAMRLGTNARTFCRSQYHLDAIAEKELALYRSILKQRSRG